MEKGYLKAFRTSYTMDMHARNQYLKTLIEEKGYLLKSKKEKSKLLNEYCGNTGLKRKYVIWKIRNGKYIKDRSKQIKRRRESYYNNIVKLVLIKCWEIFDQPCGQRLKPLLETEVDSLRQQKELACSEEVADKLKKISARTIDEKLKNHKEKVHLKQKYQERNNPLLYQKIPVKLSDEWDRSELGNIQIDLVEHCGQSARGEYLCTLSTADIATGWWEGEVVLGRGQLNTVSGLDKLRKRFPFSWKEIHSDNGTEFINFHLFQYSQEEKLGFSRSRSYKKNDNCFVEQKNKTHVKRYIGWLRYDTRKEQEILNDLYRNELHLYKNFFQPVIKLKKKVRVGSKVHRFYEKAKTPYQRVMESKEIPKKTKQQLFKIYQSLNPAQLKRTIDKKLNLLYKIYQKKNNSQKVKIKRKLNTNTVRFSRCTTEAISVR